MKLNGEEVWLTRVAAFAGLPDPSSLGRGRTDSGILYRAEDGSVNVTWIRVSKELKSSTSG